MRKLIIIVVAAIVVATAFSCNPKSGRIDQVQQYTKAIVLDSHDDVDILPPYYKYKVKLVKYDIVDYVLDKNLYDFNDTIMVVDKYYNKKIY